MYDSSIVLASDSASTRLAGASLAASLYDRTATVLLRGELGAGKTTFLQGFLAALGVPGHVISPTYALEQRYATATGQVLHLDLYRLLPEQAAALVDTSNDEQMLRCIEWSERLDGSGVLSGLPVITVSLSERDRGRAIACGFDDARLPTDNEIAQWRSDALLPAHVVDHCEAVADLCGRLAHELLGRGIIVRPKTIRAAARLHDLLRFIDFRPGASPEGFRDSPEQLVRWSEWTGRFPGMRHEAACAAFLHEQGYPALGTIVETHGLRLGANARTTIEQKLLYYADKRVMLDQIVTLDERFADFAQRYGDGRQSDQAKLWHDEARTIERELFPAGAP